MNEDWTHPRRVRFAGFLLAACAGSMLLSCVVRENAPCKTAVLSDIYSHPTDYFGKCVITEGIISLSYDPGRVTLVPNDDYLSGDDHVFMTILMSNSIKSHFYSSNPRDGSRVNVVGMINADQRCWNKDWEFVCLPQLLWITPHHLKKVE